MEFGQPPPSPAPFMPREGRRGDKEIETISWFQMLNSQREGFSDRGLISLLKIHGSKFKSVFLYLQIFFVVHKSTER
jgi:hypothetical protein